MVDDLEAPLDRDLQLVERVDRTGRPSRGGCPPGRRRARRRRWPGRGSPRARRSRMRAAPGQRCPRRRPGTPPPVSRRLGEAGQRPLGPEPFGQGDPGEPPRRRVEHQVQGGLTAHLLPQGVDTGLDPDGVGVGLGGLDEGADRGDDAGVDEGPGDVAEGVAVADPDVDRAGALAAVVTRGRVDQREQLLSAQDDADDEAGQHQQGDEDGDRPAAPPGAAGARVVRLDGDVLPEVLVVHQAVGVVPVGVQHVVLEVVGVGVGPRRRPARTAGGLGRSAASRRARRPSRRGGSSATWAPMTSRPPVWSSQARGSTRWASVSSSAGSSARLLAASRSSSAGGAGGPAAGHGLRVVQRRAATGVQSVPDARGHGRQRADGWRDSGRLRGGTPVAAARRFLTAVPRRHWVARVVAGRVGPPLGLDERAGLVRCRSSRPEA